MNNSEIERILSAPRGQVCPFEDINSVVLYGAGQMGVSSSECLLDANIKVTCFADKNPALASRKVNNIPVRHPEHFSEDEKRDSVFAISVATISYSAIHSYLETLGCRKICFVGDLINKVSSNPLLARTWRLSDTSPAIAEKFKAAAAKYSDDNSRKSLLQFLYWVAANEEREVGATVLKMNEKYFIPEVLRALGENETFVNYDSLNQNSIEEIRKLTGDKFKSIHSFEPAKNNFVEQAGRYKTEMDSGRVNLYPFGLANENREKNFLDGMGLTVKARFLSGPPGELLQVRKLDDVMSGIPYSYLKVYGLGIALDVIKGALGGIKKFRPVLAITVHHTQEDFIGVPELLTASLENYDFYLRLHSYCGFETIFYAIPKERADNRKL